VPKHSLKIMYLMGYVAVLAPQLTIRRANLFTRLHSERRLDLQVVTAVSISAASPRPQRDTISCELAVSRSKGFVKPFFGLASPLPSICAYGSHIPNYISLFIVYIRYDFCKYYYSCSYVMINID